MPIIGRDWSTILRGVEKDNYYFYKQAIDAITGLTQTFLFLASIKKELQL
jgi:hypothetical protein